MWLLFRPFRRRMRRGGETAAVTVLDEILDLSRQSRRGGPSPWFDRRLRAQVDRGLFLPGEALARVGETLVGELVAYREQAGVSTAVLGMSGGVDSALTAAMMKAAGWQIGRAHV